MFCMYFEDNAHMVKEKKHLAETSNPASLQTMKPQPVSREYVLIHLATGNVSANLTGLGSSRRSKANWRKKWIISYCLLSSTSTDASCMILPTQTMHHEVEILQDYDTFALLDTPQKWIPFHDPCHTSCRNFMGWTFSSLYTSEHSSWTTNLLSITCTIWVMKWQSRPVAFLLKTIWCLKGTR